MPEQPAPKIKRHPIKAAASPVPDAVESPVPPSSPPPEPDAAPAYAELSAVTNFSFLRGASHADELVEKVKGLGYAALAITDENSLAGVVRAHVAAKAAGQKIIVGAEITVDDGTRLGLLAIDRAAYGRLSRLVSAGRRNAPKGAFSISRAEIAAFSEGLIALGIPDDRALLPRSSAASTAAAVERLAWMREVFGPDRAFLAASLRDGPNDAIRLERYRALADGAAVPGVAVGNVDAHDPLRRLLRDTMRAIHHQCTVAALGRRLPAHGMNAPEPRAVIARRFRSVPEWIERTVAIAARCTFSLDELKYEYPDDGRDRDLRALTYASAAERWPDGIPPKVKDLIEHELALIAELRYEPYFLTVYDIVAYARSRGILCQGRGSAANSAVCFALGITAVDPARFDVLFERFISRDRNEPPDIDVDFEHERREEVLQWIYERYGRERAALAATVVTYRGRSAVRDVGKALGLPIDQVDRLAKSIEHWHGVGDIEARLGERGFDGQDERIRRVIAVSREIQGFPRHLSQHVGGMVITRGRLDEVVPIENAAMDGRTVIQWDKDDLDALKILKIDCLSLGMLTAIRRAFAFVEEVRGRRLELADVPAEAPEVYEMAERADTVGVFQIESRAQMAMLPRFKPKRFYDLVIEVALVRPGPIQGGMVHPYLRRRAGLEEVTYPSEDVRDVLDKTLGVPIFQEQVMKLAVVAAGFTPGEADMLRRAMGAWRRPGILQGFREKLVNGMLARGYAESFAAAVFEQIKGFGEYGFPESHAASFALLTYVSCWLKRFEPAAFAAALLNSQPMGFYSPAQLVACARAHGVPIRPADATRSLWDSTLETDDDRACTETPAGVGVDPRTWGRGGPALRLGLGLVKGLGRGAADRILAARIDAPFESVEDLLDRAGLARRDAVLLAESGALAALSSDRRDAWWRAAAKREDAPLFAGRLAEERPAFATPNAVETTLADYQRTGLSLNAHPMALVRPHIADRKALDSKAVAAARHGSRIHTAGLVICRQRPATASGILFVTLEDEHGFVNLVVRIKEQERFRIPILGAALLLVRGKVERDGAVVHVVLDGCEDLTSLLGSIGGVSRDFH